MNRLFFSGRNLQQALLAAARQLEIPPEEIAYVLRDQGGFIRNPKVVIEVDPAAPRHGSQTPAPRPQVPASGARSVSRETSPVRASIDPAQAPAQAAALVSRLMGLELRARIESVDEELQVEFLGADAARLAENDGELLDAAEHLMPRLLRGMTGQSPLCRVDAAGFRAARESELRQLAHETAELVRREARPHTLREMNPAERRIVHLALEADPSVTTESHGNGFRKSITVSPA